MKKRISILLLLSSVLPHTLDAKRNPGGCPVSNAKRACPDSDANSNGWDSDEQDEDSWSEGDDYAIQRAQFDIESEEDSVASEELENSGGDDDAYEGDDEQENNQTLAEELRVDFIHDLTQLTQNSTNDDTLIIHETLDSVDPAEGPNPLAGIIFIHNGIQYTPLTYAISVKNLNLLNRIGPFLRAQDARRTIERNGRNLTALQFLRRLERQLGDNADTDFFDNAEIAVRNILTRE